MHDMVFISHANPEDNDFALWLALQVANAGYPVWCDLTKLLGGEDFWKDIEEAIRERTVKFVYVLSKTSNNKNGPLQELQVATNVARDKELQDFVIPALIDDLPTREFNIQLARLNSIPFSAGWASGLKNLFEKLDRDGVARRANFSPSTVASWWREHFGAGQGLRREKDQYLSNWFPVQIQPERLFCHSLSRTQIGKIDIQTDLPYPGFQHGQFLISFAQAEDFKGQLGDSIVIAESKSYAIENLLIGQEMPGFCNPREIKKFISQLLRLSWEKFIKDRGLSIYLLANGTKCIYPTTTQIGEGVVFFQGVSGQKASRNLIGYKTVKATNSEEEYRRRWHFGISANPLAHPTLAFAMKTHVVFTKDGSNVLENKRVLHRARRSQCKDWWNDDWRDRLLAIMAWLSSGSKVIQISVGRDAIVAISSEPLKFISPVSYQDPEGELDIGDEVAGHEDDETEFDEDQDEGTDQEPI
ncbi:MAG: toll/interleukin-1 receptor domain-containing protein [Nitrospirales bacterium]|nr:toll/interleukin-1 receptor domain-containing protein [Nitrospirales bacterium]